MYCHEDNSEDGMIEWYSEWFVRRSEVFSSLADTLEQAIRSGVLAPGARLPTHRALSKRLGVAVSTVSRAYAEATRRGLIGGTVGRGTFVLSGWREADAGSNRDGLRPLERLYLPLMQREGAINLSLNEPLSDGTDERLRRALEAFDTACQTLRPRFVYTMPTLHNPTNATAGLGRRQEIVRIARAHGVLIVEDDAYGFLVEPRATPYCQLARDITIYLTSLSKSIAPALRVGFMTVPPRLHKAMRAAMRATTTMVSPLLLELTTNMINSRAGRQAIRF